VNLSQSADCNLIFYTNPQSRGQIVRWILEETGADYRQEILEYGTGMKTVEYLKINPMDKVPAIDHQGQVVTECAAICAYLADAFPDAQLAPSTSERADYYRWLFFAAGPLEAAVTDRSRKIDVNDEQHRMVDCGSFERTVDVLAGAVTRYSYIAGERFSAADVYVGSHVIWGMMFGTLSKRSEFEDYASKQSTRPAYQAAQRIDIGLTENN